MSYSEDFNQVCVWQACLLGNTSPEEFEEWVSKEFNGTRARYLESYLTLPDKKEDGSPVQGTGGRSDLMFAIHQEDVPKFAVPRLLYGIHWWEDHVHNCRPIIPTDVLKKYPS